MSFGEGRLMEEEITDALEGCYYDSLTGQMVSIFDDDEPDSPEYLASVWGPDGQPGLKELKAASKVEAVSSPPPTTPDSRRASPPR